MSATKGAVPNAGGKGDPTLDIERAIEAMLEKLEIIRQMFFEGCKSYKDIIVEEPQAYYENFPGIGFNYKCFFNADAKNKLYIILQAEEHILGLQDGKARFIKEVSLLSQAFALSVPHEKAMAIKDEVAFFQAVKARLVKFEVTGKGKSDADIETAIKQIIDEALSSDKVLVRRTLNKYGYPPDKQQKAIETVLKQAELLADFFTSKNN